LKIGQSKLLSWEWNIRGHGFTFLLTAIVVIKILSLVLKYFLFSKGRQTLLKPSFYFHIAPYMYIMISTWKQTMTNYMKNHHCNSCTGTWMTNIWKTMPLVKIVNHLLIYQSLQLSQHNKTSYLSILLIITVLVIHYPSDTVTTFSSVKYTEM
jgi:hypothetical protein